MSRRDSASADIITMDALTSKHIGASPKARSPYSPSSVNDFWLLRATLPATDLDAQPEKGYHGYQNSDTLPGGWSWAIHLMLRGR